MVDDTDLEDLPRVAKEKIENFHSLIEEGVDPFGYEFERSHKAKEILEDFKDLEGKDVNVAGRIRTVRAHGGVTFMDIRDPSGQIQLFFKKDDMDEDVYDLASYISRGDIIGVEGEVYETRKGEESVKVSSFEILSKALRDLPPEREGLKDTETRYRRRYLDLLSNEESKDIFIKRHKILDSMRNFLNSRGFIEVETPVLQEIYGGALARPFKTQHNELDREFYLRISNELYLKRLIVGGYEKVYEIVKDFRNEGIDTTHNPEFTQMEFYQAYIDYEQVMKIAEEMIEHITKEVVGDTTIEYQGEEIDLSTPWNRISMVDALEKYAGIDVEDKGEGELLDVAEGEGLEVEGEPSWGELVEALFEELVEEKIIQPTFVHDYPVETSPLAKKKRGDDRFTERFEIFIAGEEFGNAYSELNNPIEQFERFKQQVEKRKEGDLEAHEMDEDYVRALEYAMPPTGGFGIGIDRLTMLLTDKESIKEVIAFPQLSDQEGPIKLHSDMVKDKVFKKDPHS